MSRKKDVDEANFVSSKSDFGLLRVVEYKGEDGFYKTPN
ncbi:hypothetical protein ACPOL_4184 [Acidisarcina polymorpha]|uniref:Uncharacterized protein n=1 Tax=Acidisarcina polymorpha TaxID=2211140 RepID=A0A2Z5G2V2_9BACT|nr:hypothetical protein ACPOL_4184 [Acidisarcina polymorpha]